MGTMIILEGLGSSHKAGQKRVPIDRMSRELLELESPEESRNGQEETAVCNVSSRTQSATRTKSDMIPFGGVGLTGRLSSAHGVFQVSARLELARIGIHRRVVIDCPDLGGIS